MGWAQATTLIVAVITGGGVVIAAAVTYGLTQRAGRRERQAKEFAEALIAIEEYANMPYRIRRRSSDARHEISAELDKIQSQIAFQHAWLQIEALEVAAAYDRLVRAARSEAGEQMKKAWIQPPPTSDEEMSLGGAYPRAELDTARRDCITAMCIALGRRKEEIQTLPSLPR
jgi:hypothetical protein